MKQVTAFMPNDKEIIASQGGREYRALICGDLVEWHKFHDDHWILVDVTGNFARGNGIPYPVAEAMIDEYDRCYTHA